MANNNKNSILNAIFNAGTVQVLEGTTDTPEKVLVCGKTIEITYGKNPKQITSIKINSEKYSTSAISSKADACQKINMWLSDEDNTADNKASFVGKEFVYINGNRYHIYETIKDIEPCRLVEILNEYINHGKEWQVDYARRVWAWVKENFEVYLFLSRHWLEFDMTEEEIAEREEMLAGV